MIATIAFARSLPVAARDVQPFLNAGLRVFNHWEYRPSAREVGHAQRCALRVGLVRLAGER